MQQPARPRPRHAHAPETARPVEHPFGTIKALAWVPTHFLMKRGPPERRLQDGATCALRLRDLTRVMNIIGREAQLIEAHPGSSERESAPIASKQASSTGECPLRRASRAETRQNNQCIASALPQPTDLHHQRCFYIPDDARREIKSYLELRPAATLSTVADKIVYAKEAMRQRWPDGLRKAGLPQSI